MVGDIETFFPGLRTAAYRISSPRTRDYTCIAWAATEVTAWWWPKVSPEDKIGYWPAGIPNEETLDAFLAAFATLGYAPCDSEVYEPGYERVALFADPDGLPTHAARQLPGGRWTSKLGQLEDIEHDLHDIEGAIYGVVVRILKRPVLVSTAGA